MAGIVHAGVGRATITPPVGIAHAGWGAQVHERAEGVDQDFYVTVLLVRDDDVSCAIVEYDTGTIMAEDAERICALIGDATGIRPADVFVSYTHTHSGPLIHPLNVRAGMELVAPYWETLYSQTVGAARLAQHGLRPARVGADYGSSVGRGQPPPAAAGGPDRRQPVPGWLHRSDRDRRPDRRHRRHADRRDRRLRLPPDHAGLPEPPPQPGLPGGRPEHRRGPHRARPASSSRAAPATRCRSRASPATRASTGGSGRGSGPRPPRRISGSTPRDAAGCSTGSSSPAPRSGSSEPRPGPPALDGLRVATGSVTMPIRPLGDAKALRDAADAIREELDQACAPLGTGRRDRRRHVPPQAGGDAIGLAGAVRGSVARSTSCCTGSGSGRSRWSGSPANRSRASGRPCARASPYPVTLMCGYTNGWSGYVPTDDAFASVATRSSGDRRSTAAPPMP